jgi:hypothetical protein
MPKANNPMTQQDRSKRFNEEAQGRKEAGEFDTARADKALDEMVKRSIKDHGA